MIGALWTGISGLSAHQKAIDNESHNIANVNTVGYKASRISFADQMYQDKIGKGSKVLDAEKLYTQGNLKVTGVNLDMALSGQGFFTVSDTRSSGSSETYYTRAGNFRMGEDGTLQDAAGNKVQGWAMAQVSPEADVKSTNPYVVNFTNDYTKLAASKIIRHTNKIETITAKMTDYTQTAVADSDRIFSGVGLKSKSSKVSDVEALISDYNAKLTAYQSNPAATSSPSQAQISYIRFPMDGTLSGDGDQLYTYINGTKYSQSWEGSAEATMQALSDQISAIPGFKSEIYSQQNTFTAAAGAVAQSITINGTVIEYTGGAAATAEANATAIKAAIEANSTLNKLVNVDTTTAVDGKLIITAKTPGTDITYEISGTGTDIDNNDPVIYDGRIRIESIIPGKIFTVGEVAESSGTTVSVGSILSDQGNNAIIGTGLGAVKSAQEALLKAVSGNQQDVYTLADLTGGTNPNLGLSNFKYQITVYDEVAKENKTVPSTPLQINDASSINDIVMAINTPGFAGDSVSEYVFAKNVNGSLVIESKIPGIKISGSLTGPEVQTVAVTGTATGAVSFLGTAVAGSASGDTAAETVEKIIAGKTAIISAWNTANADKEISDIVATGTTLSIVYKDTEGDVPVIATATSAGIIFGESINDVRPFGTREKNSAYSGWSGAGAEFLAMTNTIEQTASKSALQLRLDTLGISDSAFGEFTVDGTGLITMKQDGAEFAIGQVAIAVFNNERGLVPVGDNLVKKSNESGEPIFNINNDKTAKVEARTLELSTADLSESLVNLMVFQRAFEANAKSITTSDELLNTLINLKR